MMPSKHACDLSYELSFGCEALGGTMLLMMQLHGDPEKSEESFEGQIVMLVL